MTNMTDFNFTDIMFGIAIPPIPHAGRAMIEAKGLHGHLCVEEKYAQWIADRITDYGFEEGLDYVRQPEPIKGQPAGDYLVTYDTAKGLALLERSEHGLRTVRHLTALEQAVTAKATGYALEKERATASALREQMDAMMQLVITSSQQFEQLAALLTDH